MRARYLATLDHSFEIDARFAQSHAFTRTVVNAATATDVCAATIVVVVVVAAAIHDVVDDACVEQTRALSQPHDGRAQCVHAHLRYVASAQTLKN